MPRDRLPDGSRREPVKVRLSPEEAAEIRAAAARAGMEAATWIRRVALWAARSPLAAPTSEGGEKNL